MSNLLPDEAVAWVNGSVRPYSQAAVPVWDLGVVAGASVTEMARTFRHRPFRLDQHVHRLMSSSRMLGFPERFSGSTLLSAAERIVRHNAQLIDVTADLGIILFTTAGDNPTYPSVSGFPQGTTVVHTFPLPFVHWRKGMADGISLRIPAIRQIPEECLPISHKIRNRLHWWLADREASVQEPGSRALLLDQHDNVTETSSACFFAVLGDEVVTPDRHVLDSMSRRVVEELLAGLDIPCRRRSIQRSELPEVRESFVSSTPCCLLPVCRIDGRPVADGRPGPLFRQLQAAWSRLVDMDIAGQILGAAL